MDYALFSFLLIFSDLPFVIYSTEVKATLEIVALCLFVIFQSKYTMTRPIRTSAKVYIVNSCNFGRLYSKDSSF